MKTKSLRLIAMALASLSISGSSAFAIIRSPYPERARAPRQIVGIVDEKASSPEGRSK